MVSNFIKPGDKIDINLLHQNNGKIYKSSVFGFLNSQIVEIAMPTDGGKMVVFNLGVQCQLYFCTATGLYTCEAVVAQRYKKENFFLLAMKITSEIKKFQRREFYRVECLMDFAYFHIPNEVAELETTSELIRCLRGEEYEGQERMARTRDISGGGIRFTAMEPLEVGQSILVAIQLTNDKVDQMFYLVADIMSCELAENSDDRWVVRAQFRYKDLDDRDLIIRYVFEQDRMMRKNRGGRR